ncbi:MAG: flagellin [Bdellovibrionota bacterium]
MGLRINTNVLSLNAQRSLMETTKALGRSLERLSSGSRINRAGDDAAGLAISEGLNVQVRGLRQAVRNTNDSLGFLSTAEAALAEMANLTQRLRELAIQSSNGVMGDEERAYLNDELGALLAEMDRIANQTEFNGTRLLDGSFGQTQLQVGVNQGDVIGFSIGDARTSQLGALAIKSGAQNILDSNFSGITIGGVSISVESEYDDVSTAGGFYSALAMSKAINAKSGFTGVSATALETQVNLNDLIFTNYKGSIDSGNFKINNVDIVGAATNRNEFIALINEASASTGVKARLRGDGDVQLYAIDGRNIEIDLVGGGVVTSSASSNLVNAIFTLSSNWRGTTNGFNVLFTAPNVFSVADEILSGAIEIRSSESIVISGVNSSLALGFSEDVISVSEGDNALKNISIKTQAEAQSSIVTIDAALARINELRSDLGATQNRLDSTLRNIDVGLENISSAQSQIRDTDIASETAELTRTQILQQAGVAVLGQSNASSQIALGLLQF